MLSFLVFLPKDALGHCRGWYRSPQGALTHSFASQGTMQRRRSSQCLLLAVAMAPQLFENGGRQPPVGMVLLFKGCEVVSP